MGREGLGAWVTVVLLGWVPACSTDAGVHYCQSSDECGDGMVCGTEDCSGVLRCVRADCACTPDGFRNVCSSSNQSECSCDAATCSQPLDSCGKQTCPGVCKLGQSCQFCFAGRACENVEPCLGSSCIADSAGQAACRPAQCLDPLVRPPQCGTADAPCGACPVTHCAGFECGDDDLTGVSCGTCGAHHYCDFYRQCVEPPQYLLCAGELQAQPAAIQVEERGGPLPTPSGGSIADGIYDLVAEQEYQVPSISDIYTRGAIRFFDAGTHAEHIYDADPGSQADNDSPHRLMNVSSLSSELTFDVTCPDRSSVIFPHYQRGYTVSGSELRLFQPQLVEIYTKRP